LEITISKNIFANDAAPATSIALEALNKIIVVQAFGANDRLEKMISNALEASEHESIIYSVFKVAIVPRRSLCEWSRNLAGYQADCRIGARRVWRH